MSFSMTSDDPSCVWCHNSSQRLISPCLWIDLIRAWGSPAHSWTSATQWSLRIHHALWTVSGAEKQPPPDLNPTAMSMYVTITYVFASLWQKGVSELLISPTISSSTVYFANHHHMNGNQLITVKQRQCTSALPSLIHTTGHQREHNELKEAKKETLCPGSCHWTQKCVQLLH